MKAVYLSGHGGNEVVVVGQRPMPTRHRGDVLVRMQAATLNRVDLYMRDSGAGITHKLPQVMGVDGAGLIDEVDDDEPLLKVGDRVVLYPGITCGRGPIAPVRCKCWLGCYSTYCDGGSSYAARSTTRPSAASVITKPIRGNPASTESSNQRRASAWLSRAPLPSRRDSGWMLSWLRQRRSVPRIRMEAFIVRPVGKGLGWRAGRSLSETPMPEVWPDAEGGR